MKKTNSFLNCRSGKNSSIFLRKYYTKRGMFDVAMYGSNFGWRTDQAPSRERLSERGRERASFSALGLKKTNNGEAEITKMRGGMKAVGVGWIVS